MDLFKLWVNNRVSKVSELLASSFLNHLLDPQQEHELGTWFLQRFLHASGIKLDILPSTKIAVYPEFSLGHKTGRIDTLLTIANESSSALIGIEVKIHDSSAVNISSDGRQQLPRYYEEIQKIAKGNSSSQGGMGQAFMKICRELPRPSNYYLVYVVPSRARVWPSVFGSFLDELVSKGCAKEECIEHLRFVPWKEIQPDTEPEYCALVKSSQLKYSGTIMDSLVDARLRIESLPSEKKNLHLLHFIGCLHDAVDQDFYVPKREISDEKHVNHERYAGVLKGNNQFDTYEALNNAVKISRGGRGLAGARGRHTCIGVPRKISNSKGGVCRIRTVTAYGDAWEVLDHLMLEFEVAMWTMDASDGRAASVVIEKILEEVDFDSGKMLVTRPRLGECHQDAKNNKPVLLVSIHKTDAIWQHDDKESAVSQFKILYDKLNDRLLEIEHFNKGGATRNEGDYCYEWKGCITQARTTIEDGHYPHGHHDA